MQNIEKDADIQESILNFQNTSSLEMIISSILTISVGATIRSGMTNGCSVTISGGVTGCCGMWDCLESRRRGTGHSGVGVELDER